ncbi:uncharacterized protein LOC117282344 [Cryptotermes secundus]|uniref:uncharacterized protein LOC117282344 n=1 Tax=Cryptotermes secundus TaxID=105785 RepID=UPI001454DC9E|nr:uncharacterized protein LOC117282344 [Cryptotermes secundus]
MCSPSCIPGTKVSSRAIVVAALRRRSVTARIGASNLEHVTAEETGSLQAGHHGNIEGEEQLRGLKKSEQIYRARLVGLRYINNKGERVANSKTCQKTIIHNEEKIEVTEGISDTENGGEIEEGVNVKSEQIEETEPQLQTRNQQTKSVEKRDKDSTIDIPAMLLTFMEILEDRMMKMENDRGNGSKMENSIKEDVHEMLAAFARDSECKMNQQINSANNEVKVVSERTHGQIQALTEVVRHNKSKSNSNMESLRNDVTAVQAQIELQSHDVCERMSTFETRVTDLRVMTEQQQIKIFNRLLRPNRKRWVGTY